MDQLSDAELDQLATLVQVRRLQRNHRHRQELTRTLDDRDTANWLEQDDVIDQLGAAGQDQEELLAFLIGLGDNEHLRGEFVEKDNKGRNIEVAIVGKHAIYFHIEPETEIIRILRIVLA